MISFNNERGAVSNKKFYWGRGKECIGMASEGENIQIILFI
jgi:hypothetical protein